MQDFFIRLMQKNEIPNSRYPKSLQPFLWWLLTEISVVSRHEAHQSWCRQRSQIAYRVTSQKFHRCPQHFSEGRCFPESVVLRSRTKAFWRRSARSQRPAKLALEAPRHTTLASFFLWRGFEKWISKLKAILSFPFSIEVFLSFFVRTCCFWFFCEMSLFVGAEPHPLKVRAWWVCHVNHQGRHQIFNIWRLDSMKISCRFWAYLRSLYDM